MSLTLITDEISNNNKQLDVPSPSMYAQYIRELSNKQILESNMGFATYYFIKDGVYIEDIFIKSEYRKTGEASRLADEIAKIGKSKGFNTMYGSIKPSNNNSTISLKVLLAYGFKLLESGPDAIIMVKGI